MLQSSYKYLRISVTDRCDLTCRYCRNECEANRNALMTFGEIIETVRLLKEFGISHIRITGGEPLLRCNITKLIELLVPQVTSIAMTTNGTRLAKEAPSLRLAGLKTINVHLDTLDAAKFETLTGGDIGAILKGIDAAQAAGMLIKFNIVLLRGINDCEIDNLIRFAAKFNAPIRFIELMPFCSKEFYRAHFISVRDISAGLHLEPIEDNQFGHGPARYYKSSGAIVGMISSTSGRFCTSCDRLRLTSRGRLRRCLADANSIDLRGHHFSRDAVKEYLFGKTFDHRNYSLIAEKSLRAIGG